MKCITKRLLAIGSILILAAAVIGCGSTAPQECSLLELQYEAIDLRPGGACAVKVESGKAVAAEANRASGLTTRVDGDTVTITAAQGAKKGKHTVTVKGRGREVTLTVNIKPDIVRGRT
jgi:hypothetical protein